MSSFSRCFDYSSHAFSFSHFDSSSSVRDKAALQDAPSTMGSGNSRSPSFKSTHAHGHGHDEFSRSSGSSLTSSRPSSPSLGDAGNSSEENGTMGQKAPGSAGSQQRLACPPYSSSPTSLPSVLLPSRCAPPPAYGMYDHHEDGAYDENTKTAKKNKCSTPTSSQSSSSSPSSRASPCSYSSFYTFHTPSALQPDAANHSNHYPGALGELIMDRYRIIRLLGRGTFSQVYLCRDLLAESHEFEWRRGHGRAFADDAAFPMTPAQAASNSAARQGDEEEIPRPESLDHSVFNHPELSFADRLGDPERPTVYVAIKVVRAVECYRRAAEKEAILLTYLSQCKATPVISLESDCHDGLVDYLGSFDLYGHFCMVFPVYGPSLFDYLRHPSCRKFTPDQVRSLAHQLFTALVFLHQRGVHHLDIKPENILLQHMAMKRSVVDGKEMLHPASPAIKLVDFGTAVHYNQNKPPIVATKNYRPPEVILRIGWDGLVDCYSCGCVIVELATGSRLFNVGNATDNEHIAMIENTLGPIPRAMKDAPLVYPTNTAEKVQTTEATRMATRGRPAQAAAAASLPSASSSSHRDRLSSPCPLDAIARSDPLLHHLLLGLLHVDPKKRLTAQAALKHPYFKAGAVAGR